MSFPNYDGKQKKGVKRTDISIIRPFSGHKYAECSTRKQPYISSTGSGSSCG